MLQKLGIPLFLLALLTFTLMLGLNSYRLTNESLGSLKEFHQKEILTQAQAAGMLEKEYRSSLAFISDLKGVLKFTDSNRRSPFNGDYNNFSPRIGFAYALNEKTSIRGGWGLLYQLSRATVYGHTGAGFNVNSAPTYSLDSVVIVFSFMGDPNTGRLR